MFISISDVREFTRPLPLHIFQRPIRYRHEIGTGRIAAGGMKMFKKRKWN